MVVISDVDVDVSVEFLRSHIAQYSKIKDAMISDIDKSLKTYQEEVKNIKSATEFLKYEKLIRDTIKTKKDIQKSVNTTIGNLQSIIDIMLYGSMQW